MLQGSKVIVASFLIYRRMVCVGGFPNSELPQLVKPAILYRMGVESIEIKESKPINKDIVDLFNCNVFSTNNMQMCLLELLRRCLL
jgi:hypothetical protein